MPGPTSTRVKSASRPTGGTAGSRLKSATTAKRPFQSAALPSLPKKDLLPKKDVGFSKEDLCLLRACESGDLDSVRDLLFSTHPKA